MFAKIQDNEQWICFEFFFYYYLHIKESTCTRIIVLLKKCKSSNDCLGFWMLIIINLNYY